MLSSKDLEEASIITDVKPPSMKNASAAEEMAAMAEELSAEAQRLVKVVSFFKTSSSANTEFKMEDASAGSASVAKSAAAEQSSSPEPVAEKKSSKPVQKKINKIEEKPKPVAQAAQSSSEAPKASSSVQSGTVVRRTAADLISDADFEEF